MAKKVVTGDNEVKTHGGVRLEGVTTIFTK